jgi:hypothetical protein
MIRAFVEFVLGNFTLTFFVTGLGVQATMLGGKLHHPGLDPDPNGLGWQHVFGNRRPPCQLVARRHAAGF